MEKPSLCLPMRYVPITAYEICTYYSLWGMYLSMLMINAYEVCTCRKQLPTSLFLLTHDQCDQKNRQMSIIVVHCPQVYCHFKFILRLIHIQFALSNHFQPKMILHCFALFNVFIRLTIANKSTDRRRIKKRFSLKLQADLSSGIHSWSHLGIEPLARSNSLEFKSWFDFNFN